jgi:hypothetical protein
MKIRKKFAKIRKVKGKKLSKFKGLRAVLSGFDSRQQLGSKAHKYGLFSFFEN